MFRRGKPTCVSDMRDTLKLRLHNLHRLPHRLAGLRRPIRVRVRELRVRVRVRVRVGLTDLRRSHHRSYGSDTPLNKT